MSIWKEAQKLRKQGMSYGNIAKQLGIPKSTAHHYCTQKLDEEEPSNIVHEEPSKMDVQSVQNEAKNEQKPILSSRGEGATSYSPPIGRPPKLPLFSTKLDPKKQNIAELKAKALSAAVKCTIQSFQKGFLNGLVTTGAVIGMNHLLKKETGEGLF